MSKGNHLNEEKKNKLNTFNNKLLQSNDEILQNDGLNLVNAQNEQNQILDKNTFNNLCSLQNSKNENTAIKASQLIADNLKINNSVDINKDEKIKTIINEGIKNENPLIQNNFLGIIAQKGNFDNKEDSKSIAQICENNIKEGINLDYSLAIINNISNKKEGNNIVINNDTTEKLFSNLNNSSPDNKHSDKILSILNNSSTNLSKEQNDIYKNNLPNLISKYPDNEKSVDLLDNYVSQNNEVTPEIVSSFYDGLNSNKPHIKEKYVSIMEKMDTKNIKEIPSDIANSLINILKNEKKPEVKNSIIYLFQKNEGKFDLNENQKNQINTQKIYNELDNALQGNNEKKDNKEKKENKENKKDEENKVNEENKKNKENKENKVNEEIKRIMRIKKIKCHYLFSFFKYILLF